MILKVNKRFLSALYNVMQYNEKCAGLRKKRGWRTVTLGNCVGKPMFLYSDHMVNQSVVQDLVKELTG